MKKKLNEHKEVYYHIRSLLPLLGLMLFVLLAIGNYQFIDKEAVKTAFTCEKDSCNLKNKDLINIYPIIGEYILITLSIISLSAFFKSGYKKLKLYDKKGLIWGLIWGLVWGLVFGSIWGLVFGSIVGLIVGLIGGLIVGVIVGLIGGLTAGLILGSIVVLIMGLPAGLIVGVITGLTAGLIVGVIEEEKK